MAKKTLNVLSLICSGLVAGYVYVKMLNTEYAIIFYALAIATTLNAVANLIDEDY